MPRRSWMAHLRAERDPITPELDSERLPMARPDPAYQAHPARHVHRPVVIEDGETAGDTYCGTCGELLQCRHGVVPDPPTVTRAMDGDR